MSSTTAAPFAKANGPPATPATQLTTATPNIVRTQIIVNKPIIINNQSPSSNAPQQQQLKKSNLNNPFPFDWDEFLKKIPAQVAPREAFMQAAPGSIVNKFQVGMRLEARDPKKNDSSCWSLANVVSVEYGNQRIRLRFDGSDSMSDIFELINSNNIKPLFLDDVLYPPMAYKGNIATYSNYVRKLLDRPEVMVAPQDCFYELPRKPPVNLFKVGQKIEAIDRKNPHLIYPATIESVDHDDVKISFDGWKGSFDYTCKYFSREIFPVNWCRDTNHPILPPRGWEALVQGTATSLTPTKAPIMRTPVSRTPARAPVKEPVKEPVKSPRENLSNTNNNNVPNSRTGQTNISAIKLKFKHTPRRESGKPIKKLDNEPTIQQRLQQQQQQQQQQQHHHKQPVQGHQMKQNILSCVEAEELIESPLSPGVDKFQCQRTVPYDEWLKLKPELNTKMDDRIISSSSSNNNNNNNIIINNNNSIKATETIIKTTHTAAVAPQQVKPADIIATSLSKPTLVAETKKHPTSTQATIPSSNGSINGSGSFEQSPKRLKIDKEVATEPAAHSTNQPPSVDVAPKNKVESWSVKQVLDYINTCPSLAKYSETFSEHEINGQAFLLLTTDIMVRYMGLKIGPVLKINDLIERAKQM